MKEKFSFEHLERERIDVKIKGMRKLILCLLLFLLSLPIIWPLLKSGYFPTHDGEWAIVRLAEMHRELRDFQIPPRWADYLNHGFGYPLFLFSYPFPYYLGEAIHLLGPGLVSSVKIVFSLSVFLSALTMFLLGRKLWGRWAGLISAIFYLYLPWRLVDLYVRGSIGESLAFIFYPLLFWLGINLVEKKTNVWIVLTALVLAGLILTHNVMALMFIPFWCVFMILLSLNKKHPSALYYLLFTLIVGFSLSAFFWLPALLEKKYVLVGQMPISNIWEHFVSLSQLIFPSWGYGLPGQAGAFSFQIGWVHLLGFILGLLVIRKQKTIALFLILSTLVLVFLMSSASFFVWHNLPIFKSIDFPWRLLGLVGFFVSLGAGGLATSTPGRKIAIILGILAVLVNVGYSRPLPAFDKGDDYYRTNDATTTSFDELMPIWVKTKPRERSREKVGGLDPQIEVKFADLSYNSKKINFQAETRKETDLRINTLYFPGWQAFVDGRPARINYDNPYGLITISLPAGEHTVNIKWQRTLVRQISDFISLGSIIAVIFLLLPIARPKKVQK